MIVNNEYIHYRNRSIGTFKISEVKAIGKRGKVNVIGKYHNYIMCNHNDDFDENELKKFFVSKIEKAENCFEITFELKEGCSIDITEYESD